MSANNGAPMTPTLIVTRPAAQSESFTAEILALWDGRLNIIQSPLLEIVPIQVTLDPPDAVIFTSANGVAAAMAMALPHGIAAWCVGPRTAKAARHAGFEAIMGPGDAAGLIADIIAAKPVGSLAHIRGMHSRGDVSTTLNAAQIPCVDVVGYDQRARTLSAEALVAINAASAAIFPLFSSRTATILNQQGPFEVGVEVVAISHTVKKAVDPKMIKRVSVAEQPNQNAMVAATLAVLGQIKTHDE